MRAWFYILATIGFIFCFIKIEFDLIQKSRRTFKELSQAYKDLKQSEKDLEKFLK
jgi:hypothetical protein